ncbi:MAG: 1,4-dihydroxy-2-naphthoate octaprenyltransferase [Petrimonas sp.]|jgi:1,4-dihydroxy-2-naphthoate octaprenyltransferase|uniref:1,4-dihydroxy-2-naphthoate octaprenyltransferase n=1 Tax=Petrimonas TaxID=307628 RepID=UPI000EE8A585|nr:1,4-dihydroxy-2-naphthoate octaprenyltransferase [Petrimonas sp.]NLU28601.1 1,4-dihydroxy-2-naphthoate octaprenyltransferase [Bacteroidales bacterium]BBD45244.1 1,4-dihydroxy-2-naphthoate octaprenyltransferase [Petrimonas sp. IBARAKI]HCA98299.1 1,4-dihydroxy-2-naphthoate octaprenyltransferase [Porphyromonadaceae bacterium]MDD3542650.1 1,4-dihydroxy-2-naphthoate octaprenyltransferase [Petrimonas sp.]
MAKLKNWISAFRLRTLFLAVAGVTLGTGVALQEGKFSAITFVLALALAVSIQILSNLANDLGDYLKGTDVTGNRQGPARAVQSGKISPGEMKTAIGIAIVIVAAIGLTLVLDAAESYTQPSVFVLLGIGLVCILSALFYTIGKYAYGYVGLGDFFAFLFFGPVAVVGTYFLHTHSIGFQPVLPAVGLGFISTMVLNINNMRDMDNDKASGKITFALRLGLKNAKIYHTLLTFGMFTCFLQYSFMFAALPGYRFLYVAVFLYQFYLLTQVHKKTGRELDPYLKLTSMSGFLLAVVFSICINI